ncbi:MAG: hypothetical protein EOM52_11285 [Clostridia bacterium]|nr:hypothetical protein [Clostridia bacterium]
MKNASFQLNSDELSVLCWQLGQLCRAGIPWQDSAAVLLQGESTPRVKAALERMNGPLANGAPLSTALQEADAFPSYLLRMVEIGQAAGRMDQVLEALSNYYKRESATAAAIRRAVTYPAVMAALIAAVFLVLVWRVLPVFARVFAEVGAGLSPAAAALLGVSSAGRYLAVGLAAILLLGAGLLLLFFRRGPVPFVDLRALQGGATAMAVARGRFSSAMALMLQSGLSLDEALERTGELLSGGPLAGATPLCRKKMAEGISFPKAVEESGILTGMDAGLLAAGVRTGAAVSAMTELAARCAAESEDRLARLLSRFEYTLVIFLCVSVGLVLLSVMLPLLGVLAAIGG